FSKIGKHADIPFQVFYAAAFGFGYRHVFTAFLADATRHFAARYGKIIDVFNPIVWKHMPIWQITLGLTNPTKTVNMKQKNNMLLQKMSDMVGYVGKILFGEYLWG